MTWDYSHGEPAVWNGPMPMTAMEPRAQLFPRYIYDPGESPAINGFYGAFYTTGDGHFGAVGKAAFPLQTGAGFVQVVAGTNYTVYALHKDGRVWDVKAGSWLAIATPLVQIGVTLSIDNHPLLVGLLADGSVQTWALDGAASFDPTGTVPTGTGYRQISFLQNLRQPPDWQYSRSVALASDGTIWNRYPIPGTPTKAAWVGLTIATGGQSVLGALDVDGRYYAPVGGRYSAGGMVSAGTPALDPGAWGPPGAAAIAFGIYQDAGYKNAPTLYLLTKAGRIVAPKPLFTAGGVSVEAPPGDRYAGMVALSSGLYVLTKEGYIEHYGLDGHQEDEGIPLGSIGTPLPIGGGSSGGTSTINPPTSTVPSANPVGVYAYVGGAWVKVAGGA